MILAAEIGPTTSHVALFDRSGNRLIRVESYRTLEYDGVAGVLQRFLGSMPVARLDAAGIGVTASWTAYAHELAEVIEIPLVVVVDGLEAHVHHLRDLARLAAEGIATAPTPDRKVVSIA
jgi:glucokinase